MSPLSKLIILVDVPLKFLGLTRNKQFQHDKYEQLFQFYDLCNQDFAMLHCFIQQQFLKQQESFWLCPSPKEIMCSLTFEIPDTALSTYNMSNAMQTIIYHRQIGVTFKQRSISLFSDNCLYCMRYTIVLYALSG